MTAAVDRADIVRAAYELFNDEDLGAALDLCDPDVEFRDLLGQCGTARGRAAVRHRVTEKISHVTVKTSVADVVEIGETVIAVVVYQVYDAAGSPIGPYVLVTDRISFRDRRIASIESTPVDEVPEEVRAALLRSPTAP